MLRREIGLMPATAMVAGIIIGASIFVQPSVISDAVPSPGAVVAVWAAAGILTLFGSLIAAELASAIPQTGGVYVYLRKAFGPSLGFLWGWAMFWTMHTGIAALIAMIFARYAAFFVPMGDAGQRATAIGVILAISAINYFGVRHGGTVQSAFTIVKVGAIVLIVLAGFLLGPREPVVSAAEAAVAGDVTVGGFALALMAGLFAFGGWHMVTYTAGETRDPERTIPRALAIGVVVVTLCYIALNAVYFHLLGFDAVARSTRVAADAADAMLGRGGAAFMSALVVFSTFGAINGIVLAGPRVYLSMAEDGLLFRWAAAVHPRYGTPHRAIALQAAWAAVLILTGTYLELFVRVIYTEWLFFALMAIGLMLLRRRPGYAPAFRVWGYPYVPVVFIVASLAIVVRQVIAEPLSSLSGLLLVGAGWPVYYFWVARRPSPPAHSES